jgi:hypothetical protein
MTRTPAIRRPGADLTATTGSAEGRGHSPIVAGSRKEISVTRHTYEIRVVGSLGPAARAAFADMSVEVEPAMTILAGELDQAALHAVLDQVRALGLELIAVRQAPAPPG